jgi:hypothetical protein
MFRVRDARQEFNCQFELVNPREVSAGFVKSIRATLHYPDADDNRFVLKVDLLGHEKTPNGRMDKRSRPTGYLVTRRDEDLELLIEAIDHCVSGFDVTADSFKKVRKVAQSDLKAYRVATVHTPSEEQVKS